MADSQLILELLFLHRRGRCFVLLFFLMIVEKIKSINFENQINKAITSCFYVVKPRVVYSTRVMLPSAKKDSVPTTQKSCVVHELSCRCKARCV